MATASTTCRVVKKETAMRSKICDYQNRDMRSTQIVVGPADDVMGTLPQVIEATGTSRFGDKLLKYLTEISGADHCALFVIANDSLSALATDGSATALQKTSLYIKKQYWRKDPTIGEATRRVHQTKSCLVRMKVNELRDNELRSAVYPKMRDRVLICGRRAETIYCLSVLRSQELDVFSDEAIGYLSSVSDLLVALFAKHAELLAQRIEPSQSLVTLEHIESCLVSMTELPRREMEVCARILYGLSTGGIAVDLGIGEESVKTYRTRSYRRLTLGSERELLKWYLCLWGAWREVLNHGPVPHRLQSTG